MKAIITTTNKYALDEVECIMAEYDMNFTDREIEINGKPGYKITIDDDADCIASLIQNEVKSSPLLRAYLQFNADF